MAILNKLFGSKPDVPKLPKLNLGEEQQTAIENNLKAAPEAGKLANFTQDQILSMMRKTNPYLDQTLNQVGKNIYEQSQGKVPEDVETALINSRAGKAFGGGYGGSGMARNRTARDFGLTSWDIMNKAQTSAESWLASMERLQAPATATLTSMFLTPAQQAGFDVEERNAQYQRQWMKNQINAMPDPVTGGLFRVGMTALGTAAGAFAGGPVGAGMGAKMGMDIGNAATSGGGAPTPMTFNFGGGGATKSGNPFDSGSGMDYESMIQAMGGGGDIRYM